MSNEEREESVSSNNSDKKSDQLTEVQNLVSKKYRTLKLVLFGACILLVMLLILVPLALVTSNNHHNNKHSSNSQCTIPRPGIGPLHYNKSVPFRYRLINGIAESAMIVSMPVIGLGTGSHDYSRWNATIAYNLTQEYIELYLQSDWLQNGQMLRIDGSIEYNYQQYIGKAVADSIQQGKITREEIWITSKIGPSMPLGYNETIDQCFEILHQYNTTYLDLLLIHWPSSADQESTDGFCRTHDESGVTNEKYNAQQCRQSVWSAMQYLLKNGYVRSIGVSNFEEYHLQDIIDMNETIPAVNQIEFHGYWKEWDLMHFCESYNIIINGYSPFAVPDKTEIEWTDTIGLLYLPEVSTIGNKYKKTPAQIWSRWQLQQGVAINPRSKNKTHMMENIEVFDFQLTNEEMDILSSFQTAKKVWGDPCGMP